MLSQQKKQQDLLFKAGEKGRTPVLDTQSAEQQYYVQWLLKVKPWLGCLPLRSSKVEYLKKTYPTNEETSSQIEDLQGKDLDDYQQELDFI